jgi:CTP:molybdopterin cytidylyltransferase MocA
MHIIALIPAAGKGSRYGMPKVDALYNGITFSQMILNTLQSAGIETSYIIRDIETPDMLASLKVGMNTFHSQAVHPDGWLIWPVDHPTVKAETVKLLIQFFATHTNSVIIPCHNSHSGHPIIIPASLALPDYPLPNGLKDVIMLSHFPVHHVEVDDPAILHNINTPEEVHYV